MDAFMEKWLEDTIAKVSKNLEVNERKARILIFKALDSDYIKLKLMTEIEVIHSNEDN